MSQSGSVASHHAKAAEHHQKAAEHYRRAAEFSRAGNTQLAIQHSDVAHGHHLLATHHAAEAGKVRSIAA
jgi:hypothetical protein